MNFNFFFGPNKIPFLLIGNGVVRGLTTPFHGIISRGLLDKLRENNVHPEVWHNNAHLLERDELNVITVGKDFSMLKEFVTECKVLSFSQSALCVKMYLENYFKDQDVKECEAWNVKEGHTSSVWKITIISEEKSESFAVNVARDEKAGIELKKSSEKIKIIGNQFPDINLAKVIEISVLQDKSLPSQVIVTRNEWIDNSYEIHSRKNEFTGEDELLMVDRFITDVNNPAHITSVYGRLFTIDETTIIQNEINEFINKAKICLNEQPEINIHYGDVVWDGNKATVIAIS